MTIIENAPDTSTNVDTGSPKVAHIVNKGGLTEAYIEGTPVEALCGEIFVPTRDPKQFPICQKCVDVREQIRSARDGNN